MFFYDECIFFKMNDGERANDQYEATELTAEVYKSVRGQKHIQKMYRDHLDKLPIDFSEHQVQTSFGETFVLCSGSPSAPPLVMFHGSGGNSVAWWPELCDLSQKFRVYSIDMIGEPGFSAPVRLPLGTDSHAKWLDEVFAALSLKQFNLVGISLGGWLAIDYASRRPGAVSNLVLMCPGGVGKQKISFLAATLPLLLLGDWGRKRSMQLVTGPRSQLAIPEIDLFDYTFQTFKHFKPRMDPLPRFEDQTLRELRMPTLLILGGKDVIFDSRETKARIGSNVPHAQINFLPEARHGLVGQSAAIREFLCK